MEKVIAFKVYFKEYIATLQLNVVLFNKYESNMIINIKIIKTLYITSSLYFNSLCNLTMIKNDDIQVLDTTYPMLYIFFQFL